MANKLPLVLVLLGIFLIAGTLTHNKLQVTPEIAKVTTPTPTIPPSPTIEIPPTHSVLGQMNFEEAVVAKAVDGDTIQLTDGRTLRYIGIDTPESVDPRGPIECFGKDASEYNRLLVTGKTVYLESDVSNTDRYGRLLRYVYLQSGEMVNEMLVREGYAHSSAYPPDIKYQSALDKHERRAREKQLGLWGACPLSSAESIPSSFPVSQCDCSKSCSDISTCQEATFQLNECHCKQLDGNNDGIACNSLCR